MTADLSRRKFLGTSGKIGLGIAGAAAAGHSSLAADPGKKVRLAMVGVRGRGRDLTRGFARRGDCEIAYLCDVDTPLFPSRAKMVESLQGRPPRLVQDFRTALDDKTVDAIVVATPDHWHALATVWGCQAGKDVYVEKPVSHSPWEGRKMVDAARKYGRVVQVGTQNRSAAYNMKAKEYLDSGKLGTIHMVRIYNQKNWPNIDPVPDGDAPGHLDWDMWNGPAAECRYNHGYWEHWNHFWRYSGGDICNDAVHQIDLARWLIGRKYPQTVYSTGGRYQDPGVFDTPNSQVAVFQYDDLVMTFELTLYTPYMLKNDPELRRNDIFPHWMQNATRIEIFGTQGLMVVGRHGGGWQVFHRPKNREPVVADQMYGRFPDAEHQENFIQSIRTRSLPNGDIEQGHLSTLLCQYANISYRLGGEKLAIDPATERILGNDRANALLKREYRPPWVVPNEV